LIERRFPMKNLRNVRWFGKRGDEGASAVEYGLLVALIAVVVAGAAWALGTALNGQFKKAKDCVDSTAAAACPAPPPAAGGGNT
jgi:pilus assembly protein Flp/PilA